MRAYPTNSPQAAARIVALTLVADGYVSSAELDALERVDAFRRLGITRPEMHLVLRDFCEDLLQEHQSAWTDACLMGRETIAQLLVEVDDPPLREAVLQVCVAVAEADGHVADGESLVLVSAAEQWGPHRQMLR
jgi:tellurite resistance protein